MCGYLVKFSKNEINKQVFESSLDNFIHRGPDNRGIIQNSDKNYNFNYSMGFQRLSILDLNKEANQPMQDTASELLITFNGEIYNNAELRKFLINKDFQFKTSHSDTETILNAYKYYGDSVAQQLEGQFSFVIFDKTNKKLFIARDRLGQKPLYYYLNKKEILFSSSLKSITENVESRVEVSYQNLYNFIQLGSIPSPSTPYSQIFKLPPATYLTIDLSSFEILSKNTYWDINSFVGNNDFESQTFESLFSKAVEKRCIADVQIGAFLSGGLDSTSVVKESKSFIKDIKTFSIGNTEEKYDESRWINQAIEKLGVDNFLKVLDSKVSKEIIYNAIDSFEEPFSDISIIPTYIISDYMSNYSKVALSGDGGDELLGGYSRYAWSSYSSLIPNLISSPLTFLFGQKEYSKLFQLSQLLENSASKRYSSFFVDTNLVNNKNFKQFNFQKKYWKEIKGDLIKSMQLADYKFYLPEVMMVKIDQTSMSNSLEVRSPFLDHKLIEYVLSTKSSGYTSYKNQKIALKKYLSGSFNSEFLNRKKKGFSIPINSILKTLESDLQNVIPFTNEIFGTYINEKDLTNYNSFELSRIWKLFILRRWIEANG